MSRTTVRVPIFSLAAISTIPIFWSLMYKTIAWAIGPNCESLGSIWKLANNLSDLLVRPAEESGEGLERQERWQVGAALKVSYPLPGKAYEFRHLLIRNLVLDSVPPNRFRQPVHVPLQAHGRKVPRKT